MVGITFNREISMGNIIQIIMIGGGILVFSLNSEHRVTAIELASAANRENVREATTAAEKHFDKMDQAISELGRAINEQQKINATLTANQTSMGEMLRRLDNIRLKREPTNGVDR